MDFLLVAGGLAQTLTGSRGLTDHVRSHTDGWPLKSVTQDVDLVAVCLQAETIQKRQEMIVGGVREVGRPACLLEIDDSRMVSLLDVCAHRLIE